MGETLVFYYDLGYPCHCYSCPCVRLSSPLKIGVKIWWLAFMAAAMFNPFCVFFASNTSLFSNTLSCLFPLQFSANSHIFLSILVNILELLSILPLYFTTGVNSSSSVHGTAHLVGSHCLYRNSNCQIITNVY